MQSAVKSGQTHQVSDIEAWSEVERELQVRHRLFDQWVESGKMAWADARDRYARLQRAAVLLKRIVDAETPTTTPEGPSPTHQ